MAQMSDFHVVGDPRFAPDVPSGGGGVSQEYVDNADIEVKKTTAKGHNTKYDESVIPSQYTNKLYVYGNSETMYPVSEIGKYINFPSGRTTADYHWDGQETRSNWVINDYKIYGKDESTNIIYDKLFAAKCINPADTRLACYVVLSAHKDVEIIANPNYASSPWNSIIRNASGSAAEDRSKMYMMMWDAVVTPPRPREFEEISMQERFTGNLIADNYFINYQYYNCQVTGMPLFVINSNSQSEFDKINRYIKENDYSGAVNASELDQYYKDSIVAIDVISGNWYNIVNDIWVKQGTLELNETGGTEVEANPQGTPTDTLNTIEIDGIIYGIEGGGGGSGSFTETTLYQSDTNESVYNLSDDISNYDLLYLEGGYNTVGNELRSTAVLSVVDVIDGIADGKQYGISNDTYYIYVKPISNVQFICGTYQNKMFLHKIIGIKFGSGEGASNLSDLSDVDLSNLSDGQILQYNSTTEKWENTDNQVSLPFEFVIDSTDNGINIVYDDGGE